LEERSTHREFDCFLGVKNKNSLKEDDLVDEAVRDGFTLFWEAVVLLAEEALPYFWE